MLYLVYPDTKTKGRTVYMLKERATALLKSYCDRLIKNQITEMEDKNYHGGILCPACSLIHGRIADSVYPFTVMYDLTRDEKYLTAARRVVDWAEYNVLRSNGGYTNDKTNMWMGISVFAITSFGEALLHHGDCLDSETKNKWTKIFVRLSDFVYDYFVSGKFHPNINYFATYCPAMALASIITGDKKYLERAKGMADYVKECFTDDGLLYGECKPIDLITPKGCRGVDLGYDVEESMPALTMYAHYTNDSDLLSFCAEKFRAHLEFMIPDGGWDNSWGTRANKWTYWGSRTSDGAQNALIVLSKLDPVFGEAALRNFEMLERCSANGYLYGGYMHITEGEEPCTHHAFCHAKSLCAMIESGFEHTERVPLPRDAEYGTKALDSVHINLVSVGDWRATVSDTDCIMYDGAATTGGTATLIYNKKYGPVFAAAPAVFNPTEPMNMQRSRRCEDMRNTAMRIKHGSYESVNCKTASVTAEKTTAGVTVTAKGTLTSTRFEKTEENYLLRYEFTEDALMVSAVSEKGGTLLLPLICPSSAPVTLENGIFTAKANGCEVVIESSDALAYEEGTPRRYFNIVGGFAVVPLCIKLTPEKESSFTMRIR